MFEITKTKDGIRFNIKVIPNASKCEIIGVVENALKIRLDVPPVDGKANEKCIKFIANIMQVPKSWVIIVKGEKSRTKTLLVKGDGNDLEKILQKFLYYN